MKRLSRTRKSSRFRDSSSKRKDPHGSLRAVGINYGKSCVGKSTLAEKLKDTIGAEVITGKDYLRLAKNESEAASLFKDKLKQAVSGGNIIYVISEREHLGFLPDGAVCVLVSADLDTIKERFRARMHGNLPAPVAAALCETILSRG